MTVDVTTFYGARALDRLKRQAGDAGALRQLRGKRRCVRDRCFPRQQPAFEAVDTLDALEARAAGQGWPRPRVFSIEEGTTGRRSFVALGREDFAAWYLAEWKRHVYEIIRESEPCRLYFDLEFPVASNPDVCGDALVEVVMHAAGAMLFKHFGLLLDRAKVLQLDSSSTSKFSRHLIVHLPGDRLFADNRACGAFVRAVFEYAREHFLIFNRDNELASFIDLGVYTRNRAFRLYLASKFGKAHVLRPAPSNRFPCDETSRDGVMRLLEASLVCPPSGPPPGPDAVLPRLPGLAVQGPAKPDLSVGRKERGAPAPRGPNQTPCPFPGVQQRVLALAASLAPGGPAAAVRAWTVERAEDDQPVQLTLNLQRHRYCARIGRAHRSNNVYYKYSFADDTVVQGCYDPDCRGFSTPPQPLPPPPESPLAPPPVPGLVGAGAAPPRP